MKLSTLGMIRVAVASPALKVGDVPFNRAEILKAAAEAERSGVQVLLFPELGMTAYTCGDLFFQRALIEGAREAALDLARKTGDSHPALVVGLPVEQGGRLFNCAAFIAGGEIRGLVPKTFLPNTQEFYEERWFSSAADRTADSVVWNGLDIPFGPDLLFQAENLSDCRIGIEICEDVWSVEPPSGTMALAGATLLLNLSASPELLAKEAYRRQLVRNQSARCLAAYAYASAGPGESSTDLVYSGHSLITENGIVLAESERFSFATEIAVADVDLERLTNERLKNNTFGAARPQRRFRTVSFSLTEPDSDQLLRPVPATPFVPAVEAERAERCREIFSLQTTALAKRLRHTGSRCVVIGVSGGLDSTLALLVAAKAFDRLDLGRKGIVAVTMPGFGTTERTRTNAEKLADLLGVSLKIISIDQAVRQHFADIGHDPDQHDITYENSQARERTQILMDIANREHGLVVGTGDLSELALGWCTYNADHMSMYNVNVGVPKTLVRYLVSWCAEAEFSGDASAVLNDIVATPFSPELLPAEDDGTISQVTEEHVGPYILHDFFLFHVVRMQFRPGKIYRLACRAFSGDYPPAEIKRWLGVFYRRFFAQQFKRSCLPDGPKIGSVVLSPRGDWRMPSDASVNLWLEELEDLD